MNAQANQVIEDPTPSPGMVLATRALPLIGVAAVVGGLGYFLGGVAGLVIGLIGAAGYADYTLRKERNRDDRATQQVFHLEWDRASASTGLVAQPAEVRRWVGPHPGSAAERSRWLVAGRDPRQVSFDLRGR
jgi:hypothetical protein